MVMRPILAPFLALILSLLIMQKGLANTGTLSPLAELQEQMASGATRYVISECINLNGATLSFLPGATLVFNNGGFKNGAIVGQSLKVVNKTGSKIFDQSVKLSGTFTGGRANSLWFGILPDCVLSESGEYVSGTDNLQGFSNLFLFSDIEITPGAYYCKGHLQLKLDDQTVWGNGSTIKFDFTNKFMAGITIGDNGEFDHIVNNVTVKDIHLIGSRDEHTEKTEWAHGITVVNADKVYLTGITSSHFRGDGYNISDHLDNGRVTVPHDVYVLNCKGNDNYRLGLSITGGNRIQVKDSDFSGNSGTDPQSGIDIEPNSYEWNGTKILSSCTDISILNCRFSDNDGTGVSLLGDSVSGIEIDDCVFVNNPISLYGCSHVHIGRCDMAVSARQSGIILQNATQSDISISEVTVRKEASGDIGGVGLYIIPGTPKSNIIVRDVSIEGPFSYGVFLQNRKSSADSMIDGVNFKGVKVSNCLHNIYVGNAARNVTYSGVKSEGHGVDADGRPYGNSWSWDFEMNDDKATRRILK